MISEQSPSWWDVIIIGGGAAGLMAAASSAGSGKRTLLLEKNRKIGVKILMSGGTRCNITHNCDAPGIIQAFGRNGRFLHSALAALSPKEVVAKIESQGVATQIEPTGKIFPVSNRAIDVRDALYRLAQESGAQIKSAADVESTCRLANSGDSGDSNAESGHHRFSVQTSTETYLCRSLIITTGGKSYPGCGTTGDGYRWAEQFGHRIVPPYPALTPILTDCQWALELQGVTVENVLLQVFERPIDSSGLSPQDSAGSQIPHDRSTPASMGKSSAVKPRLLDERRGSLLFTHWGFSGPVALDVSREVARHPHRKQLELVCDFWPQESSEQLMNQWLAGKLREPKQLSIHLLPSSLPKRLLHSLMNNAGVPEGIRNADVSKKHLQAILEQLKRSRFRTTGTLGFEKAEVTSGGVSLDEVDSKTMQSKLVEGLHFAGEVLDLDGRIGGFNFQAAFSTGWLAGRWA